MVNKTRKNTRKSKQVSVGLSRDRIVEVALDLIDMEGIENFSMRNIAKALDVYPTAVYWYIPGRNALMAEVVALILQDLAPDRDSLSWQNWLSKLFYRYRDIIRQHPNVAPLIGSQLVSNASVDFDMIEKILSVLSEAGFVGERLVAAYNVVIAGMVGFTTQEFALVPQDELEEWRSSMKECVSALDRGKYPTVAASLPQLANRAFILRWQNGVDSPLDEGFEMFVSVLVAGLEAMSGIQPGLRKPPSKRRTTARRTT